MTSPPFARVITSISAPTAPASGIVISQARTMLPAIPHRTALRPRVALAPMTEPEIVWVVDTGKIENLIKAGIIDPTMVTRSALQNAASIAKNILMTEAIVADAPEEEHAGMSGGMGGMNGMM